MPGYLGTVNPSKYHRATQYSSKKMGKESVSDANARMTSRSRVSKYPSLFPSEVSG